MKKFLYVILPILAIGCSSESPETTEPEIEMSITSCYVVKNDIQSESFSSPIGLYILSETGQPYNEDSYKNSASYLSGSWALNSPVLITQKGMLYAYYPYPASSNELPNLTVDMSKQVDLLYSKTPSIMSTGASSLSVKLHHAMSQVTVEVVGEEVSSLSIYSPLTGKFNICSGAFTGLNYGVVGAPSESLLIVPHSATGTELNIKLKNGDEYTYSVDGMMFRPGENYTYQFTLQDNREFLEIQSVSVEEWVNDFTHNDYLRK